MATVNYNVIDGGHLNIVPSGGTVYIDKDDPTAILNAAKVEVTNIDIGSGAATFTTNTLGGSVVLSGGGIINASANKITGLTELVSEKITSGAVTVEDNNVSNVKSLTTDTTTGVKIQSNAFKVEYNDDSGGVTTMTSDVVRLGTGTTINNTSVTTTTLTASTSGTVGDVTMTSGDTTMSGTLTAGEIKTSTGGAKMIGAAVTAATGNITAISSDTITNDGKITTNELFDGTITIKSGSLTDAGTITGAAITMSSGTLGHSVLTGTGAADAQITTSSVTANRVVVGDGTITKPADSSAATLSGFTSVSSATLTTGGGTNMTNAQISTGSLTCSTGLTMTSGTATIGTVKVSSGTISSVSEVDSIKFKSGTMEMYTSTGATAIHKIQGVDELSSGKVTTGSMVLTGSSNSISGVTSLTSTNGDISTLTSTNIILSGTTTLTGNSLTGLATVTSTTLRTAAGGVVIDGGSANSISGVKTLTMSAGGSITAGNVKINTDLSSIIDLEGIDITSTGTLSVGDITVTGSTNNIANVGSIGCQSVTSEGNVTAATFASNKFKVEHNSGTAVTTTTSSVFTTDVTGTGTTGVTINGSLISGLADVSSVDLSASGAITGATLNLTGAGTVNGLLTTTAGINNTGGVISSNGKIVGSYLEASDKDATSTIKGHLRVEGDLKVVNDSAKVIELTHEKMSTQDPILEFNKALDGAMPDATLNTDFGFVNVCYDVANSTKMSAGLIGDMDGTYNDVVFKFFHSGFYTDDGGNTMPGTFVYAPIACGNVVSNGTLKVGGGADPTGSEKITTDGGVKCANLTATGINTSGITASGLVNLTGTGETLTSDGTITTVSFRTQNFTQTSDARKKENVKTIDDALTDIEKLNPVTFDWKESKKSDIGFIAQEVREVFPELVQESDDGHLSVAYTGIVSPLVRAIQQQQELIRKLEERIAKLEQ